MLQDFYPYAKERLGFNENVQILFLEDDDNAKNPLGKTAYYEPTQKSISVYTTNRHPKDIMRSISHELVHHTQNCRGDLNDLENIGEEGYAQEDKHLRRLEREAYEKGNMCFRDWEDSVKQNATIYKNEDKRMSNKDLRNHRLNARLMEKWGFKSKKLEEKAESKAQQKLMAMALDCKKNDYQACASKEVEQVARMSEKDLEDYASTSTKGLPDKVAEQYDDPFDLDSPYAEDELDQYEDLLATLDVGAGEDKLPDDLENEFLAMLAGEEEESEEESEDDDDEVLAALKNDPQFNPVAEEIEPKVLELPKRPDEYAGHGGGQSAMFTAGEEMAWWRSKVADILNKAEVGSVVSLRDGATATKQDDETWRINAPGTKFHDTNFLDLEWGEIRQLAEVSARATGGCAGGGAHEDDDKEDSSEIEDAFGDDGNPLLNMGEKKVYYHKEEDEEEPLEEKAHPFDNLAAQTQQKFSVNEARTNRNRLMAEQVMKAWFKK